VTPDQDALARYRALVEAVRVISARGGDLDGTLDELAAQVQRLLGADWASFHLALGGTRVRRRHTNPLARAGAALVQPGSEHELDPWAARAVAERRCIFAPDFHAEPGVKAEAKAALPSVVSALVVPLVVDTELEGVLFADWTRRIDLTEADLEAAQALSTHAAFAIRAARLAGEARARLKHLEAAQRVSAAANRAGDLDTLLTALLAETGELTGLNRSMVALVDPDRRYVRGRVGRGAPPGLVEATVRPLYDEPRPDEDIFALVVRTGQQWVFGPDHPARHGPTVQRYGVGTGYSVLTPIAEGGEVLGVLSANTPTPTEPEPELLAMLRLIADQAAGAVARERLRAAARDALLLEGAIKTSRALAHEINQRLSLLVGYGDLLPTLTSAEAAEATGEIVEAARELGELTARLQRITRFETTDSPVGPMLDLGAATTPPGPATKPNG
jgi:GAF domain-containing protein